MHFCIFSVCLYGYPLHNAFIKSGIHAVYIKLLSDHLCIKSFDGTFCYCSRMLCILRISNFSMLFLVLLICVYYMGVYVIYTEPLFTPFFCVLVVT